MLFCGAIQFISPISRQTGHEFLLWHKVVQKQSLYNVVGPEQVHHLQDVHHRVHEYRRYDQYASELRWDVLGDIIVSLEIHNNALGERPAAAAYVDNCATGKPHKHRERVLDIQQPFYVVSIVLNCKLRTE